MMYWKKKKINKKRAECVWIENENVGGWDWENLWGESDVCTAENVQYLII